MKVIQLPEFFALECSQNEMPLGVGIDELNHAHDLFEIRTQSLTHPGTLGLCRLVACDLFLPTLREHHLQVIMEIP